MQKADEEKKKFRQMRKMDMSKEHQIQTSVEKSSAKFLMLYKQTLNKLSDEYQTQPEH